MRLKIAFVETIRKKLRSKCKVDMAHNFYIRTLLQNSLYYLQKITNQQQIEKDSSLKEFRNKKAHKLLVNGFCGLLFCKNEMKRVRLQKRKYTFFMKNRVFRKWAQYLARQQELGIKTFYYGKRWRILHKQKLFKAWKMVKFQNFKTNCSFLMV